MGGIGEKSVALESAHYPLTKEPEKDQRQWQTCKSTDRRPHDQLVRRKESEQQDGANPAAPINPEGKRRHDGDIGKSHGIKVDTAIGKSHHDKNEGDDHRKQTGHPAIPDFAGDLQRNFHRLTHHNPAG